MRRCLLIPLRTSSVPGSCGSADVLPDLPPYPGRGVVAFRDHDGVAWWSYFLTGRSAASRDRRLVVGAEHVLVAPATAREHDELRHYACARAVTGGVVVGNGDHVDAVADAVAAGSPLEDLLVTVDPEPDPPIWTPRIAVVLAAAADDADADGSASVLSVRRGPTGETERSFDRVDLAPGAGLLVHVYGGDEAVVVADAGVRRFDVERPVTAEDLARSLWAALRPDLRVAVALGCVPSAMTSTTVWSEAPSGPLRS